MWEIIGIVLTSILVFIAGFFVLLYRLSGGMRKAAQGYLNALKDKDYEKAYQYLSDQIKREVWLEDFEDFLYIRYMNEFSDYRYNDFEVAANGSNGSFKTNLVLDNESIVPLKLELMKFKGKWKIAAIDIQLRMVDSVLKEKVTSINQNQKT